MTNQDPELIDIRKETLDHDRDDDRVIAIEIHWRDEDGHRVLDDRLARAGGPSEFTITHRGFDVAGPRLTLVGGEWLEP